MLRDEVRVGTSTPLADPSGDYAYELFDKAAAIVPGAGERLKAKALQLTGGPDSPQPPEARSVYAWLMEEDRADIFLTYCTNAVLAVEEVPEFRIVNVPPNLSVGATYGLLVLSDDDAAEALAETILSEEGQAILARYGFDPPEAE